MRFAMSDSNYQVGDKARLISLPFSDRYHGQACLRFSYRTYEAKCDGKLVVYLMYTDSPRQAQEVWRCTENRQRGSWQSISAMIEYSMGAFQVGARTPNCSATYYYCHC